MCSCGREKAVFICMKEVCPNNKVQRTYCIPCSKYEEDKHDHGTLDIPSKIKQLASGWAKTNERATFLLSKSNATFKPLAPLANFLDKAMLRARPNFFKNYTPEERSLAYDLKEILEINKTLETIMNKQVDVHVSALDVIPLLGLEGNLTQINEKLARLTNLDADVPDNCLWTFYSSVFLRPDDELES
jgi:hypothetical protein